MTLIMVGTSALACQSGSETSASKQRESNHDNVISVQCSECQSGETTGAGKRQK